MLRIKKFLCCLPLTFGAYFIAIVNLSEIVIGCAAVVSLIGYLQSELIAIGILIILGIVALFWTLMNIIFLASIRKKDPHGVVDYLNIMLMITVFEFVVFIVEVGYISRFIWKGREIPYPWNMLIAPPVAFLIQVYFTYIVEIFYRKCEDQKQEELERISVVPVDIHAYENQATIRRVVSNGRVLLETDV